MDFQFLDITNKAADVKVATRGANGIHSKDGKTLTEKSKEHYKCYKCKRRFLLKSEVILHLKLFHNACALPDCRKISDFKMHSSVCIHRGFGCPVCNKNFSDKLSLLGHFNVHIDAAFHVCEICREGFQEKNDLQNHLLQVHNKNESLPISSTQSMEVFQKCHHCSKYFQLFSEYGEHVSSCNSATYACVVCHVIFPDWSTLEQHRLVEHKFENAVKGHEALRSGKRYFCGLCYLGFSGGSILRKHLETHTIDTSSFICDVCCIKFACEDELQSHYLQHVEEHYVLYDLINQHSCKSCNQVFTTQKELEEHSTASQSVECSITTNGPENVSENISNGPTHLDTANISIYALKSGEELMNCPDLKCLIIMDLGSVFVLQIGICASEMHVPDLSNSVAYGESDIIDTSLLQMYMFNILNTNSLSNSQNASISESSSYVSNESLELKVIISDSVPMDQFEAPVNTEELVFEVNSESSINDNEILSAVDTVAQVSLPDTHEEPSNDEIIKEKSVRECNAVPSANILLTCNICKNIFSSKTSLCLHVKGSHTGFDCYFCGQSFSNENRLKNHVALLHSNIYECDICGDFFHTARLLEKHKLKEHKKNFLTQQEIKGPKQCENCGKVLPNFNKYVNHKTLCSPLKPVKQCSICDKEFTAGNLLKLHIRSHIRKSAHTFECPKCKLYFSFKDLGEHIKSHDSAF